MGLFFIFLVRAAYLYLCYIYSCCKNVDKKSRSEKVDKSEKDGSQKREIQSQSKLDSISDLISSMNTFSGEIDKMASMEACLGRLCKKQT